MLLEDKIKKANQHFDQRDWNKSENIFIDIYTNYKKSEVPVIVYTKLAVIYRYLNDIEKSHYFLEIGNKIFPKDEKILIEKAALFNHCEEWKTAIKYWEEAKGKNKLFSILNYRRYLHALKNDNAEKYFDVYEEARELYKNDFPSLDSNIYISQLFNYWEYNKIQSHFEEQLKRSNDLLFDYFVFLADIGCLDKLCEIIEFYGKEYVISLIHNEEYPSLKKSNVKFILDFIYDIFIPSNNGRIIKNSEESLLIYLINKKEFNTLKSELINIKDKSGPYLMVVNYALNYLINERLLDVNLTIRYITIILESKNINILRKKYIIKSIFEYFSMENNKVFFIFQLLKDNHLKKSIAFAHNYSDFEIGAQKLISLIYRKIKEYSLEGISNKLIRKYPKVAVCISGIFRGGNEALETIKKNIIDPLNADVFIHTWDVMHNWPGLGKAGDDWVYRVFGKESFINCPKELKSLKFLSENFPETFKILNSPKVSKLKKSVVKEMIYYKSIMIESEDVIENEINYNVDKLRTRGNLNQAKMLYGIYKSISLMEDYERKNKFKYDFVFRCRPDVALLNKVDIEGLKKMNSNEVKVDFLEYGPQDQFRYGRRNPMYDLALLWKSSVEAQSISPFANYEDIDSHNLMLLWMINCNVIPIKSEIRRDISLVTRQAKIPNIQTQVEIDMRNINNKYINRIDFEEFLKGLSK